jgi:hypothetical protein
METFLKTLILSSMFGEWRERERESREKKTFFFLCDFLVDVFQVQTLLSDQRKDKLICDG